MSMRSQQPDGMFATPYGVEVPVWKSSAHDGYDFPASSAAVCAGIHDPAERKRFVADAVRDGVVHLERAAEYGGFPKLLKVALPRPATSTYNDVPAEGPGAADGATCREIVDRWVDAVTLQVRWCDRAQVLQDLAVHQMDGLAKSSPGLPPFIVGFPLSLMITSVLENLGEQEIDCIEAAAFYALAAHDQWRTAGLQWLGPVRETWWKDWTRQRQGYRRVAKLMTNVYDDVPLWLAGRSA